MKQRIKDFTAGFMWCLNILTVLALCYGANELSKPKADPYSLTPEMTARMDDLIKNITPLSVADLGE